MTIQEKGGHSSRRGGLHEMNQGNEKQAWKGKDLSSQSEDKQDDSQLLEELMHQGIIFFYGQKMTSVYSAVTQ